MATDPYALTSSQRAALEGRLNATRDSVVHRIGAADAR